MITIRALLLDKTSRLYEQQARAVLVIVQRNMAAILIQSHFWRLFSG